MFDDIIDDNVVANSSEITETICSLLEESNYVGTTKNLAEICNSIGSCSKKKLQDILKGNFEPIFPLKFSSILLIVPSNFTKNCYTAITEVIPFASIPIYLLMKNRCLRHIVAISSGNYI